MRNALIIGSEGQDGKLLKLLLRSKGYNIFGVGRNESPDKNYLCFNLASENFETLENFVIQSRPDEIYYVAAFHHSSQEKNKGSYDFIEQSVKVNQLAFIRIMELCRTHFPKCRIVYTSSSLIFSGCGIQVQNENTPTEPRCV